MNAAPRKLYRRRTSDGAMTVLNASMLQEGDLVYTLTALMENKSTKVKPEVEVGTTWNAQTGGHNSVPAIRTVLDLYTFNDAQHAIVKEVWVDKHGVENTAGFSMAVSTIRAQLPEVDGPATLQEVPL